MVEANYEAARYVVRVACDDAVLFTLEVIGHDAPGIGEAPVQIGPLPSA
jgi:hypothetical protein